MHTKAKLLKQSINNRPFHQLDRRIRQELVSIDGATLIDNRGLILAVGTILKIDGGSEGGGRLAAAKALGKLGVGIKISQDGGITGFNDKSDVPKFYIL
jgi:DNA integrity scanning protein DisA with diadenylate cyclase activity